MAAKTTKGQARKSKAVVSKTSLKNPYDITWNPVVGEDMQFILQTLTEKFKQVGLKKIEFQIKGKKDKGKPKKSTKGKVKEPDAEKEAPEVVEDKEIQERAKPGWTHGDIRKQLAIGINEVTRALEKNEVHLVLVCKSAKPAMITKHLIELSASRQVPACQLPRLSENIAPVLGLKSVLALGFRKCSDLFLEEVQAVIPRIPQLKVPWLQGEAQKEESPMEDLPGQDDPSSKQIAGRKRKISQSGADPKKASKIKLQGLKVKKIVPNPNKIRKVKNKKSVPTKKRLCEK